MALLRNVNPPKFGLCPANLTAVKDKLAGDFQSDPGCVVKMSFLFEHLFYLKIESAMETFFLLESQKPFVLNDRRKRISGINF